MSIKVDGYKPDGKRWDSSGAPDISGKISFADGSIIIIQKHQDSYTLELKEEYVKLKAGDKIEVFLQDRDMMQHDLIANGEVIYPGGRVFKKSIGSAYLVFRYERENK